MALSKNKIKYIHSLKDKKYRLRYKTFVAEGEKLVTDLLESGCKCQLVAGVADVAQKFHSYHIETCIEATHEELKKASSLKSSPSLLGVFYQPEYRYELSAVERTLNLVLDGVQDPGNFGTIVRLADWFGIENIFCTQDCCDIFNPKAVQATMGAINRVNIHYANIHEIFKNMHNSQIYGTFLNGENIHQATLSASGFIVMGNEGKGIRPELKKHINRRLFIPNFPPDKATSESLNVAVATAIVCAEFRRR